MTTSTDPSDDTGDSGGPGAACRPDAALVAEAARVLGTTGRTATVDRALATVIRRQRRREAVAAEAGRLGAGLPPPAPPEPPGWPEPAPPGGWLVDTSARRRAHPARTAGALRALLAAGRLVTCPLLDLEALAGVAAGHREALARRHLAYRRVPLDDVVARRALALQAGPGAGPVTGGEAAAPRALLLVATAAVHRLGVLHDDAELGGLAAACGVAHRPVATLGAGTAA